MIIKDTIKIATILYFIANITAVCAANLNSSEDPFIKEWRHFDGIHSYKLIISKSSAPTQAYRIQYTFPGGSASTDMCVITSTTSFQCLPGEYAVRDDVKHTVTITTRYDTYVFYDPDYMPAVDKLLGNWRWESKGKDYHAIYTISIMRGKADKEYKVVTTYSDDTGNYCGGDDPSVYRLMSNENDGTEIFSNGSRYDPYSFKYDPIKNQITSPNLKADFHAGRCIEIMAGKEPIFTKPSSM